MQKSLRDKIDLVLEILYLEKHRFMWWYDIYGHKKNIIKTSPSNDPTLRALEQTDTEFFISATEIQIIIDFLFSHDYLSVVEATDSSGAGMAMPTYALSVKGILFVEKTSFKKEERNEKLKQMWTILKIIAVVINALALIVIGYLSIK